MNSWCTINKGVVVSKKAESGAQVEELVAIYEEALRLQQKGHMDEAKAKYEELIDHKYLKKEAKNMKNINNKNNEDQNSLVSALFYVVSKNYAAVLEDEYIKNNDIDSAKDALKYYLQAVEIDPTDHSVWYSIGQLSRKLKNLRFARLAYEKGMLANSTGKNVLDTIRDQLTPIQWKCLEGICTVLYDIGDFYTCRYYVEGALKYHPKWESGELLLENMNSEHMMESMDMEHDQEVSTPIHVKIERPDLSILMEKLFAVYKKQATANNLEEEIEDESLERDIDIGNTSFVNAAIKITIDKRDDDFRTIPTREEATVPSSISNSISAPAIQLVNTEEGVSNGIAINPQKRNREDDVIAVEDEDSEQEDKKPSLRTSRRKKEKLLNNETSRLKMLEEEKEFNAKIQRFYDSLKDIPSLYRDNPWFEPQQSVISVQPSFWDWFDIKIGELESTYCWDMDGKKGDLDSLESNSKGKGLTLFSLNHTKSESHEQQFIHFVKETIHRLNENNSGIVDTLCRLVGAVVKNDMDLDNDTPFLSNNLLELITDIITALDMNFINCMTCVDDDEKALMTLRICEYFIDRLVRTIMVATHETSPHVGFSTSYKKKMSNLLSKQSKVKQIENLMEATKVWVDLLERILFNLSIQWIQSNVKTETPEENTILSDDEQKVLLRYWLIRGKLAQCQDDIQSAYDFYEKCKRLLKANTSLTTMNIKSMYDSFIDLNSIENKLSLLQVGKLLIQAKEKSDIGDFSTVIEVIKPMIKSNLDIDDPIGSEETIQMTLLLAKAYVQAKQHVEAWNSYKQVFVALINQLVTYGFRQFQSKSILCKDEDTLFFKMGKHLAEVMDELVTLLQHPKSDEWLINVVDKDFMDGLSVLKRMTLFYIFRHPDFVPLVNNFSSPDSIPHTPSRTTKSNRFNSIVVKSWVISSHIIKQVLASQVQDTHSIKFSWVKLLQELHDELGEREICCVANNAFLHHLLDCLIETDSQAFRKDIYQCYHCIYGVHLGGESDLIEEHYCTHINMDQKAAERLFNLVADAAVKRLKSGSLLKGDLKEVVEAVSDLFEELPKVNNQSPLHFNRTIIKNHLDRDISLSSSISGLYRKTLIPTVPIDGKKHNISRKLIWLWPTCVSTGSIDVYYKIFWIRGKTLRIQIKNRPKIAMLNPDDSNAWYDLGACYHQLADEELHWSATNVNSHKNLIAEYQKKALHSLLRAIYLGGLALNSSQKHETFMQLGDLLYSMASPPMDMLALKPKEVNNYLDAEGALVSVKKETPHRKAAYKLSLAMYIRAFKNKLPQKQQWPCYYAIGKCFAKIDRPPKEVLDWFIYAIRLGGHNEGSKEGPLEPVYILCSYLTKYLYQQKISTSLVMEYLRMEADIRAAQMTNGPPEELGMNTFHINSVENHGLIENAAGYMPLDVASAYSAILKRLVDITHADTKNWHHRPIYRIAWIHYHIFRNPDKAKSELVKLFTLKPTIKNHINIWKPALEL
ncbi:hypothetical protein RMCBS344292_06089 [Rhizopus microsporus]|nr:hypothetical protein RMCBS344292_06089 [Rhizopus microsporus]